MTTLKCESTFGNFSVVTEATVTDEQLVILGNKGLLQDIQRSPSSAAEKALGYPNEKSRPKNFERKSIAYSDENARKLEGFLSAPLEIADGVKITPTVVVGYHEIGAASAPAYRDEKFMIQNHITKGDFAQWMSKTVGFAATAEDAEKVEVLQAVKAYRQKVLNEA